jgi:hypothetical protein
MRPPAALLLATLCTTLSCSRPKDDASLHSAAPPLPNGHSASAAPAAISAVPAPTGTIALPTPEDDEEDSAHRITEKNLESELDRLEREIQAE